MPQKSKVEYLLELRCKIFDVDKKNITNIETYNYKKPKRIYVNVAIRQKGNSNKLYQKLYKLLKGETRVENVTSQSASLKPTKAGYLYTIFNFYIK